MASADKDKLGADLSAYLDGELSPRRARQVERILAESEDARRTLDELRVVSRRLGGLPRMRAPKDLAETLTRAAEQELLSQRRPPLYGARVLRLVVRITASAALVAICIFTGWAVLQRSSEPVQTVAHAPTAAPQELAEREAKVETLARRLPSDQSTQTGAGRAGAAETETEAPAVATSNRLETPGYVAAGEKLEATSTIARTEAPSPTSDTFAAAGKSVQQQTDKSELGVPTLAVRPVEPGSPAINVVITTRSDAEFNATLQAVARWQQPAGMPGESDAADRVATGSPDVSERGAPTVESLRKGGTGLAQQHFTLQVPPSRLNEVLQSLNEQAPEQVRVAMDFSADDFPEVQRIVMSSETPGFGGGRLAAEHPGRDESSGALAKGPSGQRAPAAAPGAEVRLGGRSAGATASRGHVVRSPVREEAQVPPEKQPAEDARWLHAYPAPIRPNTEDAQRLRYAGYAGAATDARSRGGQSLGDRKKEQEDQRQPRVEDVAAGVRARLEAKETGKAVKPSSLPTALLRERADAIRAHLAAAWHILLGGRETQPDRESDRIEPPSEPATLMLRVLLLPPARSGDPAAPGEGP